MNDDNFRAVLSAVSLAMRQKPLTSDQHDVIRRTLNALFMWPFIPEPPDWVELIARLEEVGLNVTPAGMDALYEALATATGDR